MQQQVESYKHAFRDWDEQQQLHRLALQQAVPNTGSTTDDSEPIGQTSASGSSVLADGNNSSAVPGDGMSPQQQQHQQQLQHQQHIHQ